MSDPDDKTLLEFVARFAGWDDLVWGPASGQLRTRQNVSHSIPDNDAYVPDYLHSVDDFIRDIWPKIESNPALSQRWCVATCTSLTAGWNSAETARTITAARLYRCNRYLKIMDSEDHP